MSTTFDGLFIARSGVQAARANLNITGQNITNATTDGYTRQRTDQTAIAPTSTDMLYGGGDVAMGEGVQTNSSSQMRDAFLDTEYRTKNAACGETSTQLSALQGAEDIFSTVTDSSVSDILGDAFSGFVSQLEDMTSSSSTASETAVREQAKIFATDFNTAAKQLDTLYQQQYTYLTDYGIKDVNDTLANISSLNTRIKDAEVSGTPALELQDQRNLLIDQLSQYTSVKVLQNPVDVGSGKTVSEMSIVLADKDGNAMTYTDASGNPAYYTLVDGNQYAQFSAQQSAATTGSPYEHVDITLSGLSTDGTSTDTSPMTNSDLATGSFNGYLKLLNDSGEYDTTASDPDPTARGIGYYRQLLDSVANSFASAMNQANSTNDAGDNLPLFSANGGGDITALNIQISPDWTTGYLTQSKDVTNAGDNTDSSYSNITQMITELTNSTVQLTNSTGRGTYSGTIQDAVTNISTSLGQDVNSLSSVNTTNSNMLNNIDSNRQAISSVSTDDEAINLVMYNQALVASSRFMTTVNECLETIISSMGVV